jgi:hypothetical protein
MMLVKLMLCENSWLLLVKNNCFGYIWRRLQLGRHVKTGDEFDEGEYESKGEVLTKRRNN